jgi:hypothetical protein
MAFDPKNIRLGPCRVRWGGVDLGLTKGGVEVEVTTSTKEVVVDQFGDTPVDEYITGRKVTVKTPFAESDLDTLYSLLKNAGASLVDDGAKATGSIVAASNPVANHVVTVNGVAFTFKAAPALLRDVKIGTTAAASMANLLETLKFCTDPNVNTASFSLDPANSSKINVVMNTTGVAGNAYTLVSSAAAITVSAATLAGGTASTRRRIEMTSGVGTSIRASAQELVLRPINKDDSDFSEDFVIPLAATSGALSFAYNADDERLFNLTFNGYPNTGTKLLFIYGDKRSG